MRYGDRLSGPLRDRIDLIVDVPAVPVTMLAGAPCGETSLKIRDRVLSARARQTARFAASGPRVNAALEGRLLRRHCPLDAIGTRLVDTAIRRFALSARGYDRVLKLSRSIADLAGVDEIHGDHVAEALQYRWPGEAGCDTAVASRVSR